MKIIAIKGNSRNNRQQHQPETHLMADSSLLLSNKPFFLPDFAEQFVARLSIALHINRLGRNIAKRFSSRYFDSVAACVAVEACNCKGMIDGDARTNAFDGAIMLGNFFSAEKIEEFPAATVSMLIDGQETGRYSTTDMRYGFDELIEQVSNFFTLKMGDILVVESNMPPHTLTIGETLTATIDNKESLRIRIK